MGPRAPAWRAAAGRGPAPRALARRRGRRPQQAGAGAGEAAGFSAGVVAKVFAPGVNNEVDAAKR